MKGVSIFLLAIVAASYASDVLELTDSTFESGVANKEIVLVEFFAPW